MRITKIGGRDDLGTKLRAEKITQNAHKQVPGQFYFTNYIHKLTDVHLLVLSSVLGYDTIHECQQLYTKTSVYILSSQILRLLILSF